MPILPLPQFEADLAVLAEEDRKVYEALKAPKTLVVRFGAMKLVGEFPSDGSLKPGCGSKLVVRTHRGTELGEMLTSTCANSGCSKSVSRQEMLKYIDNSGGRDYPFFTEGRVLRLATREDLDHQSRLDQSCHELKMMARRRVEELGLTLKVVDAEPLLGGERVTFFYLSEDRVDFRELIRLLSQDVGTRVELRQVGARDEARLTADYEKCGQYCCCKNFLKVLKPVSMKSAKVQKATLDPLKISGRCGRLMCCLRYEDQTYEDLRKNLPRKKSRVGTPDGDGTVLDGQILTQLVLVLLDAPDKDGKIHQVAVPVEDLTPPKSLTPPPPPPLPTQPYSRPPEPRRDSGPPRDQGTARDPAPRDQGQRDQAPRDQGARDQGPPRDRGPRRDGPPGGPRSGPPSRPPERRPPPPQAPPPTPRPPARDDAIDLDDIETDFGDGPSAQGPSGPPGAPGPQGADDANRRRRRRRRRRGGPPPGAQGQGGPGGPGPGAPRPG